MSNVIPIRENMPVKQLMTMDEYSDYIRAKRDEWLSMGQQILDQKRFLQQQIDELSSNANLVSSALLDCERQLGFMAEQEMA